MESREPWRARVLSVSMNDSVSSPRSPGNDFHQLLSLMPGNDCPLVPMRIEVVRVMMEACLSPPVSVKFKLPPGELARRQVHMFTRNDWRNTTLYLLTSMSASCLLSTVLSQRLRPVHSAHPDLYQFYLISRCYRALMLLFHV